jgi:hypothetical protein
MTLHRAVSDRHRHQTHLRHNYAATGRPGRPTPGIGAARVCTQVTAIAHLRGRGCLGDRSEVVALKVGGSSPLGHPRSERRGGADERPNTSPAHLSPNQYPRRAGGLYPTIRRRSPRQVRACDRTHRPRGTYPTRGGDPGRHIRLWHEVASPAGPPPLRRTAPPFLCRDPRSHRADHRLPPAPRRRLRPNVSPEGSHSRVRSSGVLAVTRRRASRTRVGQSGSESMKTRPAQPNG